MNAKKYIPRPLYFNKIEPFIGTGLIKVLTGQRRVGKSYVLLQVMDEIRKHDPQATVIYINKEDYLHIPANVCQLNRSICASVNAHKF